VSFDVKYVYRFTEVRSMQCPCIDIVYLLSEVHIPEIHIEHTG